MSAPKPGAVDFLLACAADPRLAEGFNARSLPELLFHARTLGYSFSGRELAAVVGALERHLITERMGQKLDARSGLWVRMWGKPRFQYVVEELVKSFSAAEVRALASPLRP